MEQKMTRIKKIIAVGSLTLFSATLGSVSALADNHEYWAGKTLTINVSHGAGGGYDTHARLLGRHIVNHLPGEPDVRVVNRPGAGGAVAANYFYEQADRDGTEILISSRELALGQRMGSASVRYDVSRMNSLGSPVSSNRVWLGAPDTNVTNLAELMQYEGTYLYATPGGAGGSDQMVELLESAGYPVQTVTGFPNSGDQLLAKLRGDVQGSVATYPNAQSSIEEENLIIVAKLGDHPDLEPYDDVRDHLEGDMLSLASILAAPLAAGRPFFAPQEVPEDVLAQLRQAFEDTMNDPAYIRELEQMGEELAFTPPDAIEELFRETLAASDAVIAPFME